MRIRYTPIEYSHKLDVATNLYEVKLLFKRNWGSPAVETLLNAPTPSQLDEWKLYLVTAANEREINRSPTRIRLTPQGKEPRSSALLSSPEFIEALRSESPSHNLMPSEPSTPTPMPRKKQESGPVMASMKLDSVPNEGEDKQASSRSPPMSTPAQLPPSRGRKKTTEEKASSMRTSDLIDMFNEGPDDSSSSPVKESQARRTLSKSPAGRKKMMAQGNEERSSMRTSDLIDMLSDGPDDTSSPTSSVKESSAPRTPSKSPARKKKVAQDNEERGGFMRSSDFMDMLKDDPPGEASSPSAKSSPASGKNVSPLGKKSSSVNGKSAIRDSGIGGITNDVEKGGANEPPVIIKKRGKARDPYDIDEMMDEIEKAVAQEEAAEEEADKRVPKS